MYKKRNMYKILKDKIVVLDFDGTLAEFRYSDNSLLPVLDKDFDNYCENNSEAYNMVRPLKTVMKIIKKLKCDDLYILSTSPDVPRQNQKIKWLAKYYKNIKKDNIFFVNNDEQKYCVLLSLKNKNPNRRISFIEDSAKTLLYVEERNTDFELYHITSFMK